MNCDEIAAPEFKTSQDKTDVQKDRYNLHLNTNTFFCSNDIYIYIWRNKTHLKLPLSFSLLFLEAKQKKNDAELLTIRQQHDVSEKLIDLKK